MQCLSKVYLCSTLFDFWHGITYTLETLAQKRLLQYILLQRVCNVPEHAVKNFVAVVVFQR